MVLRSRQDPRGVNVTFFADPSVGVLSSLVDQSVRSQVLDAHRMAANDALDAVGIPAFDRAPGGCVPDCSSRQLHVHVLIAIHPARVHGRCDAGRRAFIAAATVREVYAAAIGRRLRELVTA
ncbi:hypothetical protein [Flexivirga caeni]|uniref:hypothetical protein n=1 Tax=Flexivirga caeni TaxID=2294115 RepID=UPI0011CE307B|nr:hypothetical protein [Flexivirga caeni]